MEATTENTAYIKREYYQTISFHDRAKCLEPGDGYDVPDYNIFGGQSVVGKHAEADVDKGGFLGHMSGTISHNNVHIPQKPGEKFGTSNDHLVSAGATWRCSSSRTVSAFPSWMYSDSGWWYASGESAQPSPGVPNTVVVSAAELWRHWKVHATHELDELKNSFNATDRQIGIHIFLKVQYEAWQASGGSEYSFGRMLLNYVPTPTNTMDPFCICIAKTNIKSGEEIVFDRQRQCLDGFTGSQQRTLYGLLFEDLPNVAQHDSAPKFFLLLQSVRDAIKSVTEEALIDNLTWNHIAVEKNNEKLVIKITDNEMELTNANIPYEFPLGQFCFNRKGYTKVMLELLTQQIGIVCMNTNKHLGNKDDVNGDTRVADEPLVVSSTITSMTGFAAPVEKACKVHARIIAAQLIAYSTGANKDRLKTSIETATAYPVYKILKEQHATYTKVVTAIKHIENLIVV